MGEDYIILFTIWNAVVFLLYGIDKSKAINNKWRISEKTLITVAFLMGALGAVLGMRTFRHKTRKPMFCALIAIAVLVNLLIFVFVGRDILYYGQNYFA